MSETTNSAEIKITADASGVETELRKVDEATARTDKSLSNLGRNNGMDKLGEGAAASTGRFVSGTKSLIDAIERRTQTLELGKKGTVEYFEALANVKGVNPSVLKPYLDQLEAVTRKTAEAAEAQTRLDSGNSFLEGLRAQASEIGKTNSELLEMRAAQLGVTEAAQPMIDQLREAEDASGGLSGALGVSKEALIGFAAGIAGAFSLGALVTGVNGAIGALADLDDMAQKTGSSVETLSRLQKVASVVGQDFGAVDSAIGKVAKGMAGLDEDSNKVNAALKRLGVSSKDTADNLRDPSEVLIDAAKNLQNYADDAYKTALINDLLGKSGADLLPYLNDVAETVGDFSGASAAAAKQAGDLQNSMGVLRVKADEFYTSIATMVVPAMTDLVGSFADAAKGQDAFTDDSISTWADDVAIGLAMVADRAIVVGRIFSAVAGGYQAFEANLTVARASLDAYTPKNLLMSLYDGKNPNEEIRKVIEERNKIIEEAGKKLDIVLDSQVDAIEQSVRTRITARTSAVKDALDAAFPFALLEGGKASIGGDLGKGANDRAAAADKEADAYRNLLDSINERIEANAREVAGLAPLTEAQKQEATILGRLLDGQLKLAPAHEATIRAKLKEALASEAAATAVKKANESYEQAIKIQADYAARLGKTVEDALREATTNEALAATFGMSKVAIEQLTIARSEDRLEQLRAIDGAEDEVAALELVIAAKKRSAAALGSAEAQAENKRANDAMTAEWQRAVDKYDDVFREGFADMLNNGKDGWKSFTKSLVTTFRTTVADAIYNMFAKKYVVQMVGSFAGVAGVGGAPNVAQAASNVGLGANVLGDVSKAYSLLSGGMTLAGGLGTGFAGSVAGGLMGAGAGSGLTSAAGLALGEGIAGVVGPSVAGAIGTGMSAVAAALPWLAGAAVAGVLLKKAFGRGPKETTGMSLNGMFDASGAFSGTTDTEWMKKGGWLRSDKSGVDKVGVDAALQQEFSAGYNALKAASADFAEALGINADVIKTRAQSLSIAITGDKEADQKAITDFFVGVGNSIALELVPTLSDFTKKGEEASAALQRIAVNYAFVDEALAAIGKQFGAVGIDSIAARERLVELTGGLDALGKGSAFFAENFLTEAERLAPVAKKVADTFAELGISGVSTRLEFKNLVLGQKLMTEEGAKTYAGLMSIQEAFALLNPELEQAAAAVNFTKELRQQEIQIMELTGDKAGALAAARALELEGMDAILRPGQERIDKLKDEAGALALSNTLRDEAVARNNSLLTLQAQIYQLTGDKAGMAAVLQKQHIAALAAADPALRSYIETLYAVENAAKTTQGKKDVAAGLIAGVDDAFAVLQRIAAAEKARAAEAHNLEMTRLQESIDAESTAIATRKAQAATAIASTKALSDTIRSTLSQMSIEGDEVGARASAQAQVRAALAIARSGGPLPAADSIKDALSKIANSSADQFASMEDYLRDAYSTKADVAALGALSDSALSVQEQTLKVLEEQKSTLAEQKEAALLAYQGEVSRLDSIVAGAQQQIDVLKGIDTTGLSIVQGLEAVRLAIVQAAANPIAGAAAPINDAYKESLGRAPDAAGLEYWKNQIAGGASTESVVNQIATSMEAEIQGLYKSLLGRSADAAGLAYFIKTGSSIGQIYQNITDSDEYKRRLQNLQAPVPSAIRAAGSTTQAVGYGSDSKSSADMSGLLETLISAVNTGNASNERLVELIDDVTEGGNGMRADLIANSGAVLT